MAETAIRVLDRTWETMTEGAESPSWPGEDAPKVGQRVVIFDKSFEFTQHDVVRIKGKIFLQYPTRPKEESLYGTYSN